MSSYLLLEINVSSLRSSSTTEQPLVVFIAIELVTFGTFVAAVL